MLWRRALLPIPAHKVSLVCPCIIQIRPIFIRCCIVRSGVRNYPQGLLKKQRCFFLPCVVCINTDMSKLFICAFGVSRIALVFFFQPDMSQVNLQRWSSAQPDNPVSVSTKFTASRQGFKLNANNQPPLWAPPKGYGPRLRASLREGIMRQAGSEINILNLRHSFATGSSKSRSFLLLFLIIVQ